MNVRADRNVVIEFLKTLGSREESSLWMSRGFKLPVLLVMLSLIGAGAALAGVCDDDPPLGPTSKIGKLHECGWLREADTIGGVERDFYAPGYTTAIVNGGVLTGSMSTNGADIDGLFGVAVSDGVMDLFEGGQYIMRVDASNEASVQAFIAYAQSTRMDKLGWIRDLRDAFAAGASHRCNRATGNSYFWFGAAFVFALEGSPAGMLVSLYEFNRAFAQQLQDCLR